MTGLDTFSWQRTIRNLETSPAIKNVACWLCSYANSDGTHLHPGVVKLAGATGLTRDQVNEVLAALRGAGLLTRTKRGGGQGSHLSDEYELTMPELGSESPAKELERLLSDEYELARKKRRDREHARYESRKTNRGNQSGSADTNRGMPPEDVPGDPDTNRGTRDTNRGITDTNRGGTTPPSRKPPPLNPPSRNSNDPLTAVTVEGGHEPSGQDRPNRSATHKSGSGRARRRPQRQAITSGMQALGGLCFGLGDIDNLDDEITPDQAAAWAADLDRSIATLRSFERLINDRHADATPARSGS